MITKHTKPFLLAIALLLLTLQTFAQLRLPKGYFWKQLPNGLQVLVIENNKVPLVTVEIAVKNGAFTEDVEYNGLSHMFEHMFFKANRDYPNQEKLYGRLQELGAIYNGTTDVERVNYYMTLYKDSLKASLQFMNTAIRFPIYREEDMKKERPVVDGEFQGNENDPNLQLFYAMQKHLWGNLFSRKNVIGIHEVINTATPEKMMAIKNKYYFPNNSLLTICGDVKHEDAFVLAENIFGDWANSGFDPIKKYPIPTFKPLTKNEYFIKETPIAQAPIMQISWHGPSFLVDSASTVAADVFSTIIALNSSKMQQALVNKGLATGANLAYATCKYVGSIDVSIQPNPDKMKECYAELLNQINQFANPDYYTDEQLNTAKAIALRNSVYNKEKPSILADQASFHWCSTSLNFFTDMDSNYQKVSRADITRYINLYIKNKPMIAGLIISPEMSKKLNVSSFFKAQ